jgi:predicted TIM-barrel fold metal-dependent hydrolase
MKTTSRREFLGGLAALGAGALLPGCQTAPAASAAAKPHRIDVHHHLAPPRYLAALGDKLARERPVREWTPGKSIADMDAAGVATSVTSITYPGLWFGDAAAARALARECNDYAAKLRQDYPGRFGMFVNVPLPDVDGALREIEYGLDTLKADGVAVQTSYGNRWLGDAAFAPLWEEMNRRKAVVYTHPTAPECCRNLMPEVQFSVIEFGTDTTRAIASLLFTGTAARYPDIRWIFSHAGGTAPYLVDRLERYPLLMRRDLSPMVPNGVVHELEKFYYDVAQAANPVPLAALTKLAPVSHILFGTDFPFRASVDYVKDLAGIGFSAADLRAIERDNALRLMPELKSQAA